MAQKVAKHVEQADLPAPDKRVTFFDKCVKDRSGAVVLGQSPNLPIITWIAVKILAYPASGEIERLLHVIAFGTLFTWAWLELFQGVNYFRRALGLTVLLATISGALAGSSRLY